MGVKLVSASGGSVEIVAPATASNYTATMPANNGTVITTASTFAGTGPAFSASKTGDQNISVNTWTKVTLSVEDFDTNNCYDPTTNYRFTPNVAGYYQINYNVNINNSAGSSPYTGYGSIYKNGAYAKGSYFALYGGGTFNASVVGSCIIYMNGTTDYVELYANINTAGTPTVYAGYTNLSGALVRAA